VLWRRPNNIKPHEALAIAEGTVGAGRSNGTSHFVFVVDDLNRSLFLTRRGSRVGYHQVRNLRSILEELAERYCAR
jgi:hypothetical protein